MATFDSGVFDFGVFDTTGSQVIPAILKVCVPHQYHFITGNQAIPIIAYIITNSTSVNRRFLLDPFDGVIINIYAPDNTIFENGFMARIDTGIYLYTFNQSGSNNGVYSATFQATNGLSTMTSKKYFICQSKPELYAP